MSDHVANVERWLNARDENVKLLRRLAVELDEVQKILDIANIVSTGGSIVSGVSSLICFALAVPTGGISTIPGFLVGGFGFGSFGISVGSFIFEYFSEKDLMRKVQNALDKDRFESLSLKGYISNLEKAKTCIEAVSGLNTVIESVAKLQIKKKAKKEAAAKVCKKTAVIGCVLNMVTVPMDIANFLDTCIKANKGSTHQVATQIRGIIQQLEDERDQIVQNL